jgi:sterol desaturase/sphingolipid hydroxylase (fatty acid hydroxylase superfamily)
MMDHVGTMLDVTQLQRLQIGIAACALLVLWSAEMWRPFLNSRDSRLRHACRNLFVAGVNGGLLALLFASANAAAAEWAERTRVGLLHWLSAPFWVELVLAILFLDAWMYAWHRANHAIPFLWRFHRMHHSDPAMDVTTALRFHPGELAISAILRLTLIPVFGLTLWQIVLYDLLLFPVIALHHSNIDLPRTWDRWLRAVLVSPGMHRVHHSDWEAETNSNYSSIFSWWDRIAGSHHRHDHSRSLRYGVRELYGERWQSLWGLLKTPFVSNSSAERLDGS